jgi:MoaA/NifB/PqqE/SkfB family radical SAM enzyme
LTFEEFEKLSLELGDFENLNLSGGEPFIRKEFAEICGLFIRNNHVKNIYVPTNGYFTDRTEKALRKVLEDDTLKLFVCEISLDGMPEYHNRFRGNPRSFERAMETCAMLTDLQREDPRLRIHANTVAMGENMDEIWQLTEYLHDNCPGMEHHNLAIIRGDRKNPSLKGPQLEKYKQLYHHVTEVWRDKEKKRFGASVEPMLQWAKVKTIETESQFIPCKAGVLTGVIYANGDVSVCEQHLPLGNLRENSFFEIWDSQAADRLRAQIKAKQCYCTNEIFMWSSIVFQPVQLTRAAIGARNIHSTTTTNGVETR